jgi:hypothetical protein
MLNTNHHSIPWLKKISLLLILLLLGITISGSLLYMRNEARWESYVGEYYMGDGFVACRLSLRANQTFHLVWWQDNMVTREFDGIFVFGGSYIELSSKTFSLGETGCLSKRLILVKWEDRRYLFYNDNDERSIYLQDQFCENVNDKIEFDRERSGSFYPYINNIDKERMGEVGDFAISAPVTLDGSLFCAQ